MRATHYLLFLSLFFLSAGQAQFLLQGEFRPRTEYRQGYGSLIADTTRAGFGISSRLRLTAGYQTETYRFHLSLQDVMVWGENPQLFPADQNHSLSFFEAWAQLQVAEPISIRLGRQVISHDDERIFGAVDWVQQGRNHDAALIAYTGNALALDLGFAYNQDYDDPSGFQSEGNTYTAVSAFSYKSMQFLYSRKRWKHLGASILFLNTGFQRFTASGQGEG